MLKIGGGIERLIVKYLIKLIITMSLFEMREANKLFGLVLICVIVAADAAFAYHKCNGKLVDIGQTIILYLYKRKSHFPMPPVSKQINFHQTN